MLWIGNGKILTMDGDLGYDLGWVGVCGGKIAYVGEECGAQEGDTVLDAHGGWILPGLVEAHCHVGIQEDKKGAEGDDCNEGTNPVTPWLRAIDGINPMDPAFHCAIKAGITSVMVGPGSANVVGGQFVFMKTHGRTMEEMIVKFPAAMKVAFGENPKTLYGGSNSMPATRMAIAGMLRQELSRAVQYRKEKEAGGGDFTEDFTLEPWLPVLSGEIPLKAHAHRADDILTAIRIAREFGVSMTLDHCTEGHLIADEIRESGFPAICGPHLANRNKLEIQNSDFKTPGILAKKGILTAIMTDHPVSMIQYLPICAAYAVKNGMDEAEALRAITVNAAKICGAGERVGRLKKGLDADVAVFDGNPMFVQAETLYTIIDGQIVYDWQKDD